MTFGITVDHLLLAMIFMEWRFVVVCRRLYATEVQHNLPRSPGNPDMARGPCERAVLSCEPYVFVPALISYYVWRLFA